MCDIAVVEVEITRKTIADTVFVPGKPLAILFYVIVDEAKGMVPSQFHFST